MHRFTYLTDVAIYVKVLLHSDDSDSVRRSLHGSDSVPTGGAFGSENFVKVVDAVDLVVKVNGEGNSVQALIANGTSEATRMVRVPHRLKDL